MSWPRTILHVDMDAFYASVEQLDNPALRGKPVLVGGNGRRGVVGAASYEARKFGCRSAMPMGQARALCPQAIVTPPRFHRYRELSERLMEIIERYSPLVEPLSLDEAFADVTGSERLHGDGVTIAKAIRSQVREELGLTCSVGVAPNKFVAKLGSDLQKPDGLSVLPPDGLAERLAPLAIERMWGVGPVTAKLLHQIGVRTFGDLQAIDGQQLENLIGESALDWKRRAFGEDDRPVHTDHTAKSVGHEQTFGEDLRDRQEVESHLMDECDDVAARLRRKGLKAGRLTVKIRFGDFKTITRSLTLDESTDRSDRLREAARTLFRAWADVHYRPVRLIGCSTSQLSEGNEQLSLFDEPGATKHAAIDKVSDAIRAKFGKDAIARADVAHHRNERWTDREAPRGRD
ncbi:MAG: DNA polymerase IV [Phycisphaerae bacterium]|nr:DNA polymerase IV [Phycisphaerae bacterium]